MKVSLGKPLVILPRSENYIGALKVHLESCSAIKNSQNTLDSVYFWNDGVDNYISDIVFNESLKYECVVYSDFANEPARTIEFKKFPKKHLSKFCKKCQVKLKKYIENDSLE